jgi:tetratricopeptide (TPR) repeat protein
VEKVRNRLGLCVVIAAALAQVVDAQCALDRAIQLHQSGDFLGALREYQTCVAAEPNRVEARSNLGAVLVKLGRYQDAIDQYQAALKIAAPELAPRLRLNLGLAYYKSFQIPEAVVEFESVHKAMPTDLNVALLLADCRLRAGEFQEAIDVLQPLETSQPDQPALDYVLGMALIRKGRVSDGQLRVDRILGRGESAEGHFLLGSALFAAGDYPKAVSEFAKASALNPDVPSLQSYYGQALLFTGDADGAAEAFHKELAANPNDFDATFQLASILARRGKTAEARPLLEHAAQLRPGSLEAKAALEHGFGSKPRSKTDPGVTAGSSAPPVGMLNLIKPARPVVLVFGSYTCPKLRGSARELKRIAEVYRDRADFRLVYIREAHPESSGESEWQSTINIREGVSLAPARTLAEKKEHAELCLRKLDLPFPAVIDGMDGAAEAAYHAWPSRLYVVGRDGKVAYNTRLGEFDFQPEELEAAIGELLGARGPNEERR